MYGRRAFPAPPGVAAVVLPAPSGTLWLSSRLPRRLARDRPDVFFGPGYTLPASTVPAVVALHDLSFEGIPGAFPPRERLRRRLLARLAAARARAIVCLAPAIAAEIAERYRPACPVHAIPPGIDPMFGVPADAARVEALRATLRLEPPVLLFAGSLFNRRHPEALVEALAAVRAARGSGTLVLAGDNRTLPRVEPEEEARRHGVGGALRTLAFVPDADLRALLELADLFLWPSDYEGFGLPPLEAMMAGVPVVSSTALAGTLGDGAILVGAIDGRSLADAALSILADPVDRERRVAAGRAQASRYDRRASARETLAVLARAAEEA